jgi:hypothetical protein
MDDARSGAMGLTIRIPAGNQEDHGKNGKEFQGEAGETRRSKSADGIFLPMDTQPFF